METVNEKISNVTEPAMDALGRAGEKLKETGSSLTNTVRQNPIPFALVGLGLGMFIVSRVRNADGRTMRSRTYESDSETGYGMATPGYAGAGRQYGASGEYAGAARQYGASKPGALRQMTHTANELAHGTAETVSHLGHQAKEGAVRAGRGLQRLVHENPLAVGAAAIAVGAAVGLALPSTQIEHEYMGEASEKIVDKAQQVARDAMDKVKTATQPEAGGQQPRPGQQPNQPGQQKAQPANQPNQQPEHRGQAGEPGQPSVSQRGQSKSAQPGQPTPRA